jgi:hypothetical protein
LVYKVILIVACLIAGTAADSPEPAWGFYGHRKINRMAVFTLPQSILPLYKKNIEYITEHAVDPDKRRYASKNEFARHYIDIDHWDTLPFNNVPKLYRDAILKFGQLKAISEKDTVIVDVEENYHIDMYRNFLYEYRFDPIIKIEKEALYNVTGIDVKEYSEFYFDNDIVNYGISPYFLEYFYSRLVYAFDNRDIDQILKISADIGHYISDAHVPLHTTLNYNGQLTGQIGIHAFWESRLPELYADFSYDFIVGRAEYIENIRDYVWEIIKSSHELLPEVLEKERLIKAEFPEDKQFCYDERLGKTIWIQCPEFSKAYHDSMGDMVESRMRASVLAIGSIWYSAWVDAGQPDLELIENVVLETDTKEQESLDAATNSGKIYGREH